LTSLLRFVVDGEFDHHSTTNLLAQHHIHRILGFSDITKRQALPLSLAAVAMVSFMTVLIS
jgi:hypothetical protein